MKTIYILFLSVAMACICATGNAQLIDRLGKKAEKAAERTVERRVERETEKKTDKTLDKVFNKKDKKKKKRTGDDPETGPQANGQTSSPGKAKSNTGQEIVSGSTFFPDGEVIFEENFAQDAQGDFPANWETTSGGEIILVDQQKALKFYPNSLCMASTGELPENYALEFDLITANLDYKELSGSEFRVQFVNENKLKIDQKQRSEFHFSLWQGSTVSDKIHVENYGTDNKISNNINYKMNNKFNKTVHFTAVVNGKRLRVYLDNEKVIDLPSFLQNNVGRYVQFYLKGTSPALDHIAAIANLKITEEGEDLRSMILKGGFSTTKILFDSGSDQLKSSSFTFLDKLGKTLESDGALKVRIIGHTDSDGDSKANLTLSEKRALAVKKYLLSKFSINDSNLQTEGKGEGEPVSENATAEGKAKNRRVEFKKI